jgi:CDP-paratose 2-epimerase
VKIIVTGVAGFIGASLASKILGTGGASVIGLDDLSRRGAAENLEHLASFGPRLTFHRGDVRDAAFVTDVVGRHDDADGIVHLAGQTAVTSSVDNPRRDFEANAVGTFNVLEAVRTKAPSLVVVYASTNKVYGGIEHETVRRDGERYAYVGRPDGIDESCPLDFHSPYGCSKGAGDQYVRDYARIYGLKSVVFRQSCIYGPRQFGFEEQGWVAWFTIAALINAPITVFGDGYQTRDLLWVDDLCELYLAAIAAPGMVAGQVYNVGGGPATARSVREVLSEIGRAIGRPIPTRFADWRPGDQRVFVADISRLRQQLNWTPKTLPQEGIPRLVRWAHDHLDLVRQVAGATIPTP